MNLVEDLGMQYAKPSSKQKTHYGIYECPYCNLHFRCIVYNVTSGTTTKCRSCASKALVHLNTGRPSAEFTTAYSEIHNNKYDYSLVHYIDRYTKVEIICPTHGVFWQRPKDHRQGQGCPSCAVTGFDKDKSAILYYLKVTYGNTVVFKIGITNRTIQKRFSKSDFEKIQVLKIWEYELGKQALSQEQEILSLYKDHLYTGEPVLASGNTELFILDVLGLDVLT